MRIALLSTSDTDLLSARASGADYVWANPTRVTGTPSVDGCQLGIVRLLGGPQDLEGWYDDLRATGIPLVVLGGEQQPNAELMERSTVPIGIAAEAHRYLAEGGPANLAQLHAFLSDTVLLTGEGFEPPVEIPAWGLLDRRPPVVEEGALAPVSKPGEPTILLPRVVVSTSSTTDTVVAVSTRSIAEGA